MSRDPIIIPTTQDLEEQIKQLRQELNDVKRRLDNAGNSNQRSLGDVGKVIGVLARAIDSLRPPHMPQNDRSIFDNAKTW